MATLKPKHLYDLRFVSDPALSPDARLAAAVHTVIVQPEDEDEAPRYRSNIYLYDLEAGTETQFTRSAYSDTQPRFSPDGSRLAFLSKREKEGKPQLYVMPLGGGEAEALTSFKAGVGGFAWHPDGERIAFVSRGDWEDEVAKKKTARTLERLQYKYDGMGFRPTEPAQLYLYDIKKGRGQKLTDLVSDPGGLAFSPDGKTLYFTAAESVEDADAWLGNLHALTLKSGKVKALLPRPGMINTPSPSPDGAQIVFYGPSDWDNFGSPNGLWRVGRKGGEPELITGELDTPPTVGGDSRYGSYPNWARWTSEGDLIVNVNEAGRSALARLEPTGKRHPLHGGDRAVTSFDYRNGIALFTCETPEQPGELFVLKDEMETQLSSANAAFVKKFDLQMASAPVTFKTRDKTSLTYWTLAPKKPRKDRALVLQVHGGPHTNYGYGFYLEFQILAAAGYTVLYGNPRGSSGFGSDFATTAQGRYGSVDADDVLATARHALKRHSDSSAPIHLTGGSYGGFMTNWLVGHSDLFASAVTQRSICNWLSFYGASDIGYKFTEQEQGGAPWRNLETLWNQSPLKYVEKVTTPTLILHSEQDHRCPIEQAEQFYIALKRLGQAPTKFIRFPDEGHELSRSGRPDRRVERLTAILEWFKRYP